MPHSVLENVIKVEVADDLFHYFLRVQLGVSARKGHGRWKKVYSHVSCIFKRNYNSKLSSIVVISKQAK